MTVSKGNDNTLNNHKETVTRNNKCGLIERMIKCIKVATTKINKQSHKNPSFKMSASAHVTITKYLPNNKLLFFI